MTKSSARRYTRNSARIARDIARRFASSLRGLYRTGPFTIEACRKLATYAQQCEAEVSWERVGEILNAKCQRQVPTPSAGGWHEQRVLSPR